MSIGLPNEEILFAVYAVQLGFATPTQVADAAAAVAGGASGSLADRLEHDKVLNAQQRMAIQRRLEKELGETCETISTAVPSQDKPPPLESERTVDLGPIDDNTMADPPSIDPGTLDEEVDDRVSDAQAGRYTMQGMHASGGQARIMLAIDEHIGREVAIKEMRPDETEGSWSNQAPNYSQRTTPGMVRFLREARVTGQLEHPNIVPVHEVGKREDGTFYYTMRFVRGDTLASKLKQCRSLPDRIKLLGAYWDVCQAISFAHSRGVVHRDIKPENIMVGEFGETVLLDWGVAKIEGKRDIRAHDIEKELRFFQKEDTGKTADGTAIGTPSYMSPEQARGEIDVIDERSDVWGLGAVLYEILTGRPPYTGDTSMVIILKVGNDPLVPVLQRCPEAPPELAAVAEKALQKDRDKRYQKSADMTTEIAAYMTGSRVGAYDYSSWELFKRFAAKNKGFLIAAAVILLVIIGALISVSFSLRAETQARLDEEQAHGRAELARAQEQEERRTANYHLAQAYAEKADRMVEDVRHLAALAFAAASLVHNPAHPKSPFHSPDFEDRQARSRELWVEAASRIYRLGFGISARLDKRLPADEVLTRVAFSPDGKHLAAASLDNSVRLWDLAQSTRPIRTHVDHGDQVYGVAWSPDGRYMASCAKDGKVLVYRTSTGKVIRRLGGHIGRINQVVFSPNSRQLASAGYDGTVRLWNVKGKHSERVLKAEVEKFEGVAFSPDGRRLAGVGTDGKIHVWETRKGKQVMELTGHSEELYCVAYSPNGRWLASAGNDKTVRIWNAKTGSALRTLKGHQDGILTLVFSPDSRLLASASYDKTVRLWAPGPGQALLTIGGHRDFVYGAAFSPDGKSLATSGYDKVVRLWRLVQGRPLPTLRGHSSSIYTVAHSPDGKWIATGSWDKTVRIWSTTDNKTRLILRGHTEKVDNLAISPDSTRIASAGRDETVRVWDAASGRQLYVISGHTDRVYGVEFSPDGELLATASSDQTIRIWEAHTGKPLRTIQGHDSDIDNLSFSPDGKLLASAGYDKTVRLWYPRTGEQVKVLQGHSDWISGVDFSPDGEHLASSGKDGQVIVWDLKTGTVSHKLTAHTQWVNTVRYSPDGALLASASDDRTVRVWSARNGLPMMTISASIEVVAIEFSPDSEFLAIGDGQVVKRYPLNFAALKTDPRQLLKDAERNAGLALEGFELRVADAPE